jgi:uroporphyrinogen decarboxylase
MTPRERIIAALERRPISGLVPHYEGAFYPTMEAIGKVHPGHRDYSQWDQMLEKERQLHRREMADIYVAIAERYGWSAIFISVVNPDTVEETCRLVDLIREKSGNRYFIIKHGDPTMAIPSGDEMEKVACRLIDEAEKIKQECNKAVDEALAAAEKYQMHGGIDSFELASDYCFNSGPFLSPSQFSEFVTPFLAKLIAGYRSLGFYAIKHCDGNIMPIIDQLVEANPHALQSLDPQGNVDIAEVKKRYGDKVCLIGNVNCALLSAGTEQELVESTEYALKNGMPGGGYIFSTSNCIYTGAKLSRYELMLDVWKRLGNY